MNSLLICVVSACFAALTNLFFRKNSDNAVVKNSQGYLAVFFFFSFLFSLVICHDIWHQRPHLVIVGMGAMVGVLNLLMLSYTAKALQTGPSGMTFVFQNASCIFPGILLFLIFGQGYGFTYSYMQFLGAVLVVMGFYIGAKKETSSTGKSSLKWLKYALICLAIQILALSFIQGRCLFFNCDTLFGLPSAIAITPEDDAWFMPIQFGVSMILQMVLCLRNGVKLEKSSIGYGSLAGLTNAISTFLLLVSTQQALPNEKAMLIPCFAASTMILCNLWSYKLYREHFHTVSNATCALGIFLGSAS